MIDLAIWVAFATIVILALYIPSVFANEGSSLVAILVTILICAVAYLVGNIMYTTMYGPKPTTYSLPRNRWSCTAEVVENTTTYVLVGKIMMPTTTSNHECTQYNRKVMTDD